MVLTIGHIINFLKSLSPVMMILIGAGLFFFSDAVKWLAKALGLLLLLWGVATLLGIALPPPVENIENVADNLGGGVTCFSVV